MYVSLGARAHGTLAHLIFAALVRKRCGYSDVTILRFLTVVTNITNVTLAHMCSDGRPRSKSKIASVIAIWVQHDGSVHPPTYIIGYKIRAIITRTYADLHVCCADHQPNSV
ncbi:uncharacterized protein LOC112694581 [Sipha flava]|uniref:Uncharacterized protein LOC112694581 n=1 Tax=Sipha flava TaxID=143950 RepID=A0A8B8GRI5_9HEMI|nr:uncharacterized protein LOC112694581 [Sipha flava]